MGHIHLTRAQALGALGAVTTGAWLAQAGIAQPARHGLVDVHHHFYPPQLLDVMNAYQAHVGEPPVGGLVGSWTVTHSLDEMDRTGIQTAFLSLASPRGVWFGVDPAQRKALSRTCNEFAANLVRQYPGRFGLFASLPMPDVDASLAELAYALDTLHADAIGLPTSWGDIWPGDARANPLWEELNRRRAIVVFHPYTPNCCVGIDHGVQESFLEYPFDTARAALNLLVNGRLLAYPNIRWVMPHGGGEIPMLAGRVATLGPGVDRQRYAQYAPNGIDVQLKQFYFDTANAFSAPAMAALLAYAQPDRILFGTDYPYVSGPANADGLDARHLPPATLAAIQRGNAAKVFPRLAASG